MKTLKQLRQMNGLSQRKVSEDLLIPQTTLFSYESGVCDPNIETLCKLADYYHISLDELVGRKTQNINLYALNPIKKEIIQTVLQMNELQEIKVKAYLDGLMQGK